VSHETIYRSLFIQARGVLKKELLEHLRAKRTIRRSRHASLKRSGLGQIKDAVSIRERPALVEDRAVPGHWEGDLIGGSRNSYVATLVERHSRYVMLVKVANKDTESVVSALIKQSQRLPSEFYRSLTWDRGKELADHQRLTLATEIDVYFCDPRCPWQRGSNENTNRLLRQYLPRGTDLSLYSQAKLSAIARQLNERPRKTLLYQTPAEKFAECVAAISCTRRTKRRSRNVCSHAAVGGKADVSPSTITKLDVIRERWRPGRPCFERVLGSLLAAGFRRADARAQG
jgi:IS30 family transposase